MKLLPPAVFEQHIIALGKTGAGKSSAIRFIVEHLLDQEKRVIIVTPKADFWGLKLAADGKNAGYPVPVFGGQHQDLPLSHHSGKTMAELLGTGNRSAILQMRDFMPGERTTFWIDFASTLFRVLQGKVFLVIDEVHNFAPKGKVLDNQAGMMLHWSNKLASEARGIGITLIGASQRASKVHNDFLTSCETLIAMRVTTKWDRDAVKDWIEGCGDPEKGKEVLNSLAQMKRGDAWVWSPEAEFGPKPIHFPMFKTYDSFRPQSPSDSAKLKGWADVDLADVKKKLEHVVKEAEANDPKKLKARIRELESARPVNTKPNSIDATKVESVARPLLSLLEEAVKLIVRMNAIGFNDSGLTQEQIHEALKGTAKEIQRVAKTNLQKQSQEFEELKLEAARLLKKISARLADKNVFVDMTVRRNEPVSIYTARTDFVNTKTGRTTPATPEINGDLNGPQKKIMVALAELRSIGKLQPSKNMVAAWASYSVNGSAFTNPLGALRAAGLIEYPSNGIISFTGAGAAMMPNMDAPTQEQILSRIQNICTGPEWKIFSALLSRNREKVSKSELAELSEYSEKGSAYINPLGALRTMGLLDYPSNGYVQASEWIFEL